MSDRRPIGIFDSGVGGLTVVRAVRALLPAEGIVYLGDTARVPYGSKSPRTVERYALACQKFLLERHVRLVMIACNTASATALPALAAATDIPVIGAVIPGARAAVAASQSGHIGVIGTLATVRSKAYEQAISALRDDATVTAYPCPLLVPLAEEGWTGGVVAETVVRRYLSQLWRKAPRVDTLVLGCTHYPLLRDTIRVVACDIAGREISVVDSASSMARAAETVLGTDTQHEGSGDLHCYATDATQLDDLAPRFLGEALSGFDLVDL